MCNTVINIATAGGCEIASKLGDLAGDGVGAVANAGLDAAADSAGKSAGQFVTNALGWWTYSAGVNYDAPAITHAISYTLPITTILLTLGVVVAGVKTAISRKGEPTVNLVVGLVSFLIVSTAGVALFAAIQAGGDAFARWVIGSSSSGFGDRLAKVAGSNYTAAFGVIILSLVMILLAVIQWILMLFRYGGLVVLAVLLPTAAAASVVQGRNDSLKKVLGWSIGLLLYKPIAALIYAIGFTLIGEAKDISTLLQGAVVLLLALIALPTLVSLFSWAGASSGGGSGAALALAGTGGAMALSRSGGSGDGGGGGGAAGAQASYMAQSGPSSGSDDKSGADRPATSDSGGQGGETGGKGPGGDAGPDAAAGAAPGGGGSMPDPGGGFGGGAGGADAAGGAEAGAGAGAGAGAAAGPAMAAMQAAEKVEQFIQDAGSAATPDESGDAGVNKS